MAAGSSRVAAHISAISKNKKYEQELQANKNLSNLAYYTHLTERYDPSKTPEPLGNDIATALKAELIEKINNSTMNWDRYDPAAGNGYNPFKRYSDQFDTLPSGEKKILNQVNDKLFIIFRNHARSTHTDDSMDMPVFFSQRILENCKNAQYLSNRVESFTDPEYPDIVFYAHPFYLVDVLSVKIYLIIADNTMLIDYFFHFV